MGRWVHEMDEALEGHQEGSAVRSHDEAMAEATHAHGHGLHPLAAHHRHVAERVEQRVEMANAVAAFGGPIEKHFNPDEARGRHGEWTGGGEGDAEKPLSDEQLLDFSKIPEGRKLTPDEMHRRTQLMQSGGNHPWLGSEMTRNEDGSFSGGTPGVGQHQFTAGDVRDAGLKPVNFQKTVKMLLATVDAHPETVPDALAQLRLMARAGGGMDVIGPVVVEIAKRYNPEQPRGRGGQWSDVTGGGDDFGLSEFEGQAAPSGPAPEHPGEGEPFGMFNAEQAREVAHHHQSGKQKEVEQHLHESFGDPHHGHHHGHGHGEKRFNPEQPRNPDNGKWISGLGGFENEHPTPLPHENLNEPAKPDVAHLQNVNLSEASRRPETHAEIEAAVTRRLAQLRAQHHTGTTGGKQDDFNAGWGGMLNPDGSVKAGTGTPGVGNAPPHQNMFERGLEGFGRLVTGASSFASPVQVEKGFNPFEHRNAHGEWTNGELAAAVRKEADAQSSHLTRQLMHATADVIEHGKGAHADKLREQTRQHLGPKQKPEADRHGGAHVENLTGNFAF